MSLAELELFPGQTVEILTPTGYPTRRIAEITSITEQGLCYVLEPGKNKVEVLPKTRVRAVWDEQALSLPTQVQRLTTTGTGFGITPPSQGVNADLSALLAHLTDFNNPHNVTRGQIGLGNVDNTSDLNKPISNATRAEFSKYQNILDRYLQGDIVVRVTGADAVLESQAVTYTCEVFLENPTYQWRLNGTPVPGATGVTFTFTPTWEDEGAAISCAVTSGGLVYRSNSIVLRVADFEARTGYDFYISPDGSDANTGLSESEPWRTFAPLATYMDSPAVSGLTKRVRVATGTYTTSYAVGRTYGATTRLFIDLEPGVVIQRGSVVTSHGLRAAGNLTMHVKSLGAGAARALVRGFNEANGSGLSAANTARLHVSGLRVTSCHSGILLQNTAVATFRDVQVTESVAAAYRQESATASGVAINTIFTARSGVTSALITAPNGAKFVQCRFVPQEPDTVVETNGAVFLACQLGTVATNVLLSDTSIATQQTFEDCFVNVAGSLFGQVTMLRCYGKATFSVSGNSGRPRSTFNHCVFAGAPTNYTQTFLYRAGNLGVSPTTISNTVFTRYSSTNTIGQNFTSTENATWNSQCFVQNCCFHGNGGTWVPGISASVSGSLLVNPVLGSVDTLFQADYAVSSTGPCVGAGTLGSDIGFLLATITRGLSDYRIVLYRDLLEALEGQAPSVQEEPDYSTLLVSTPTIDATWDDVDQSWSLDFLTAQWNQITNTPTTLVGYGITDAQPLDTDLTAIAALVTTAYGRGFLTLANASAARTYIGAGTSNFDGAYSSLTGIPLSFNPSSHMHGNVTNDGRIGTVADLPVMTGAGGLLKTGSFGTTALTFTEGNDPRLSDARTPLAHTHGNITNVGAIGSTANLPIITGTSGLLQAGSFGSAANTFCQGNDPRLSDARTPTAHNHPWSQITSTPTTLAGYGITDAQPLDADLTAIAALSTTAYGRGFLTLVDAPAARTYIGAGTSNFDGVYSSLTGIPTSFNPSAHTHGNITNNGTLGSTANIPLITGAAGVIQAGSFGTAANTFCVGNDPRLSDARTPLAHTHGNISNTGTIGSTANLPLITGVSGLVQTGSFGTAANTFCVGNDARLSDARTPLAHTHGNISNTGAVGVTANLPLITGASGVVQAGSFGTAANTFCQGNDARLSDARTPLAHVHAAGDVTSGVFNVARIPDLDASKITTGTINIARLPASAIERLTVVANNAARFALNNTQIQNGDTVKVNDTGFMYFVVDDTQLSTEAGYEIYTAGGAASVPWAGITDKPTEFPPTAHTHDAVDIVSGLLDIARIPIGSTASTVTVGNDPRLSDARIPLAHTHGNITNTGSVGSTANLPLITGVSGLVQAGSFGTAANTFCQGNDARLSDARTPLAHTHGNISNTGTLGSTANLPLITGVSGLVQAGSFGTAANTFCQGNDARLSDARTPLAHTHGNITNAGAIGVTAGVPIITGSAGVLQAGSFGTTTGTFAQGDDARFTDAREWTAITVSQEEAEAGVSTTRRAWTAERVRQAIEAWATVGPLEDLRPVFIEQPTGFSGAVGGTGTLTADARTIPNTHLTLSYQWEFSTDGGLTYDPVPGGTTTELSFAYLYAGQSGKYRLRAINTFGSEPSTPVDVLVDNAIEALYGVNDRGIVWDLDRMDHLFQASNGATPVTAYGDPVGLILTRERGGLSSLGATVTTAAALPVPTIINVGGSDGAWDAATKTMTNTVTGTNNTYPRFRFAVPVVLGRWYRISGVLTGVESVRVRMASGGSTQTVSGTFSVVMPCEGANILEFLMDGQLAPHSLTISELSVREVPGTHLIQATSSRRPTYARRPKTGVRNLLQYTEVFENAYWTKASCTISANADAPTGFTNSRKLTVTGAFGGSFSRATTWTVGQQHTVSCYAKAAEFNLLQFRPFDDGAFILTFDLSLGTITTQQNQRWSSATITPVGNGWYLCQAIYTPQATTVTHRYLCPTPVSGSNGILITGTQIEVGTIRTNYQRVTNQFDVTETGQPSINYLWFDGIDDCMQSASAIDFSNSDEMTVCLGLRKLTDAGAAVIAELSTQWNLSDGTFLLARNTAMTAFQAGSRGTATVPSGDLVVPSGDALLLLTSESKISSDFVRLRNSQGAWQESTADQGTGNYGNHVVNIGSRNQTGSFHAGHLNSGFIINRILSPELLADYEKYWVAVRAGIELP